MFWKNHSKVPRKESKLDEVKAVLNLLIHFFIDFLTLGKWNVFVKKVGHQKSVYYTFVTTTEQFFIFSK